MKDIFKEEVQQLEKIAKTLKEKYEDHSLGLSIDEDQQLYNVRTHIDFAYKALVNM